MNTQNIKPTRSVKGPDPIDIHVGSRVRLRRTLLGYSQEKLADALGITFQQVQKYENGANRIGSSRLFQIGQIMNVPVSFFFEGAEDKLPGGKKVSEEKNPVDDIQLSSRETIELIKAYYAIQDPSVRKKVFEMIKSLAKTSSLAALIDS